MRNKMKTGIIILILFLIAIVIFFCPAVKTDTGNTPTRRCKLEMGQIRYACIAYKTDFGFFPTGSVTAVFQELTGKNSRTIPYIEISARNTASDGTYLDPWGTPYRISFEYLSNVVYGAGGRGNVSSAGRDHLWGTEDDLEIKWDAQQDNPAYRR